MSRAWIEPEWGAPPGVRALSTLRHGAGVSAAPFDAFNLGVHAGDDPTAVARNREILSREASLPASPCWLRQVHGTRALRVEADSIVPAPEADAAVTSAPGVVLAILTADCLPVLFCAEDGSEVGAAHAGWRGLSGGVLENTLAAMRAPPSRVLAWLGPAAGPQAYEIGTEVREAFVARDAAAATAFVATRPGHWRVDLFALARQRLEAAGVARVHGGGVCTLSDPSRFFSHRRDARGGRMASLIWIGAH